MFLATPGPLRRQHKSLQFLCGKDLHAIKHSHVQTPQGGSNDCGRLKGCFLTTLNYEIDQCSILELLKFSKFLAILLILIVTQSVVRKAKVKYVSFKKSFAFYKRLVVIGSLFIQYLEFLFVMHAKCKVLKCAADFAQYSLVCLAYIDCTRVNIFSLKMHKFC